MLSNGSNIVMGQPPGSLLAPPQACCKACGVSEDNMWRLGKTGLYFCQQCFADGIEYGARKAREEKAADVPVIANESNTRIDW